MAEKFIQIDTAVLDQYSEVIKQQRTLEEFRVKAEQMKGRVDEAVSRRVIDDYAARLHAINTATEPLRAKVRAEFERLRAAYDRFEQLHERAWMEKQELEFRQQVGEIDAIQATERLAGPAQTVEDCRQGMARLEQIKARFIDAFGSEEALLGYTTRRTGINVPTNPEAKPASVRAIIRVEGEGPDAIDFALGAITRIGRADENEICLQSRGLSRQHAMIVATAKGFTLRDLDSQNGTLVNDQRISERELADGDLIVIGDARLRFTVPPRARR